MASVAALHYEPDPLCTRRFALSLLPFLQVALASVGSAAGLLLSLLVLPTQRLSRHGAKDACSLADAR